MAIMDRRDFITLAATGASCISARRLFGSEAEKPGPYKRANTDWLAKCRYGVGVHWTAQTVPRHGSPLPFQKAVDAFDVKKFVDQLTYAGADYLLFTAAHALQMLPAPNPVIDKILPGRTCKRDLIAELADALAAKGMPLLVYYNHSCNGGQDRPWEQAVGYHDKDKQRFAQNLMDIVGWMGERYKDKIKAWWFDSPYSLDPRGPHNSVTTDMTGFQFPWERFTVAAKTRLPGPARDLQSGRRQDLPLHDPSGLLVGGTGQPQDARQGPVFGQRPAMVRLDVHRLSGLGPHEAGYRDSQAAILG